MDNAAMIFGRPVALTGQQIAAAYAMRDLHSPAAMMAAARDLTACALARVARPAPIARPASLSEVRKRGRANMAKLCRSMGLKPNLPAGDR